MADLPSIKLVIGASQTLSDLVPFLVVMAGGFLIGAWGQSARVPIAVLAGIVLVMIAIAGFLIENGSGTAPDVTP